MILQARSGLRAVQLLQYLCEDSGAGSHVDDSDPLLSVDLAEHGQYAYKCHCFSCASLTSKQLDIRRLHNRDGSKSARLADA